MRRLRTTHVSLALCILDETSGSLNHGHLAGPEHLRLLDPVEAG